MWQVFIRTYAPYITFPFALVIGFVGYNFENLVRGGKQQPYRNKSILEEREERKLEAIEEKDPTEVDKLKEKKFVPRSVLDKNQPGWKGL
ncbi:small integral membrane protein 12-like [Branchiostoma floridae x Branchiostoma japonicum]